MSRAFGIWVSVALFVVVALAAIPTFLTFHGSKSSPGSSQAIPVAIPSSVVPYPRPEAHATNCSTAASRSARDARESGFFTPITRSPCSLRTAERHRTPAGIALSRCD
jgi:hypothetical protein